MGFFDFLKGGPPKEPFFAQCGAPNMTLKRLADAKSGALPWVSTLTTSELALAKSHGMRMIATVASTCWLHYGFSWTQGHAEGWQKALDRLQAEAFLLGANAVIDVKMVTVRLDAEDSMDFSLVGTAVRFEGLKASVNPIVSTVPALEFIELLDAGIVPVGIAVGAQYAWTENGEGFKYAPQRSWVTDGRNFPLENLTAFWERIRRDAHAQLRADTARQGDGVLAQVQFGQLVEYEGPERRDGRSPTRYLGRHIVIGTVVSCKKGASVPQKIQLVLEMDGRNTLSRVSAHHNSYADGV